MCIYERVCLIIIFECSSQSSLKTSISKVHRKVRSNAFQNQLLFVTVYFKCMYMFPHNQNAICVVERQTPLFSIKCSELVVDGLGRIDCGLYIRVYIIMYRVGLLNE